MHTNCLSNNSVFIKRSICFQKMKKKEHELFMICMDFGVIFFEIKIIKLVISGPIYFFR